MSPPNTVSRHRINITPFNCIKHKSEGILEPYKKRVKCHTSSLPVVNIDRSSQWKRIVNCLFETYTKEQRSRNKFISVPLAMTYIPIKHEAASLCANCGQIYSTIALPGKITQYKGTISRFLAWNRLAFCFGHLTAAQYIVSLW